MITISIIDFIGIVDDGVGVILSLLIDEKSYEIIYWFNKNNDYRLVIEDKFYKNYPHVKNIYDYEYFSDLIKYIDNKVLPKREEIWKEFNF
jgi:hypothetical protein